MRVVIQKVKKASVTIDNKLQCEIGQGLLILLGIEAEDTTTDIEWLCGKITKLRIFNDENNKMNHSIMDVDGAIMVVSQFTLFASTKKGNRPSYLQSAPPAIAIPLYEEFITSLEKNLQKSVKTGTFGAMMDVALINDGPVTIIIDSKNKE